MTADALYPYKLLTDPPQPTYPEYPALIEQARRTVPRFVDPANIYPSRPVAERRGADWCTAVLGRPYEPHRLTTVQDQLLILADVAGIDPPLPGWIVEARAGAERIRLEREQRLRDHAARDAARWAAVKAAARVELTVREGSRARPRHGVVHPIRHAVPTVDVQSGKQTFRIHRAGRALCEAPNRSKRLALGNETPGPATCTRCLDWATKVINTAPHSYGEDPV